MGGFFGAAGKRDVLADVFFGTDYHSHLGTKSAGIAAYDRQCGLRRKIHNIGNAPFRTKFEDILDQMSGTAAIGCINDSDPQPLLVLSKLGRYALCFVGILNNAEELIERYVVSEGGSISCQNGGSVNSTELLAALINHSYSFADGIRHVWEVIDGTASILILKDDGKIIAARDK